jgi:hypothetical protein
MQTKQTSNQLFRHVDKVSLLVTILIFEIMNTYTFSKFKYISKTAIWDFKCAAHVKFHTETNVIKTVNAVNAQNTIFHAQQAQQLSTVRKNGNSRNSFCNLGMNGMKYSTKVTQA